MPFDGRMVATGTQDRKRSQTPRQDRQLGLGRPLDTVNGTSRLAIPQMVERELLITKDRLPNFFSGNGLASLLLYPDVLHCQTSIFKISEAFSNTFGAPGDPGGSRRPTLPWNCFCVASVCLLLMSKKICPLTFPGVRGCPLGRSQWKNPCKFRGTWHHHALIDAKYYMQE